PLPSGGFWHGDRLPVQPPVAAARPAALAATGEGEDQPCVPSRSPPLVGPAGPRTGGDRRTDDAAVRGGVLRQTAPPAGRNRRGVGPDRSVRDVGCPNSGGGDMRHTLHRHLATSAWRPVRAALVLLALASVASIGCGTDEWIDARYGSRR